MAVISERRQIVLGITGSIAAYKGAELARKFVKRGFDVRVVLSDGAEEFITPLTFSALTRNPVVTSYWEEDQTEIGHIELADWADAVVVAPASADFLAKARAGIADNPLLGILLATKAPVLLAPAMNVNMLKNPATVENIEVLQSRGIQFVEPSEGSLACGWHGRGRMSDPWDIFYHSLRVLSHTDYLNKRVLVVTGPTREAIDPVRFISNRSSGKMGIAIAREAFRRGADVEVIHGPIRARVPLGIETIEVVSALEMKEAVEARLRDDSELKPDIIIMTAAVADYRPKSVSSEKLKKSKAVQPIELTENPDILASLGALRGDEPRPVLVGFAVETGELEDLVEEARRKLQEKKVDMIIGNFAEEAFDLDTNRIWMIDRHGKQEEVATNFKSRIAERILNKVRKL